MTPLIFVVLLGLLVAWVPVPHGSVAPWAQSLVTLLLISLWAYGGWLKKHSLPCRCFSRRERRTAIGFILLFFGWAFLQLMPIPLSLVSLFSPLTAEVYAHTVSEKTWVTLSFSPHLSVIRLSYFVALAALIQVCSQLLSSPHWIRVAAYTLAGAGTFHALLGFMMYGGGGLLENPYPNARMNGVFVGANGFGGLMAVTLPITYGAMGALMMRILSRYETFVKAVEVKRGRLRVAGFMMLVFAWLFQTMALFMSASRSAIFISLLLMLYYAFRFARGLRGRWTKSMAWVSGGVFFIVLALSSGAFAVAFNRFYQGAVSLGGSSLAGRLTIWKATLDLIREHPLGVGVGCYELVIPQFQTVGMGDIRFDLAHNDLLQLIAEWGFPGAVGFLGLLILFLRNGAFVWSTRRVESGVWQMRGLYCAVIAGLAHALVDYNLSSRPGVAVAFVVAVGLLLASIRYLREDLPLERERRPPLPLLGKGAGVMLALIIGVAGAKNIRHIQADLLGEAGWGGSGVRKSFHHWLDVPGMEKEEAWASIDQAIAREPWNASFLQFAGRARISEYDLNYEKVIQDSLEKSPGLDQRRFKHLVRIARTEKAVASFNSAIPYLEKAVRANPWDINSRAYLLVARAELSSYQRSAERFDNERFVFEADLLKRLAPADSMIWHLITRAEFARSRLYPKAQEVLERLAEAGVQTLAIGSFYEGSIAMYWYEAGVPLENLLSTPHIAPSFWLNLYIPFEKGGDKESCLAILEAMKQSLIAPPLRYNQKNEEVWARVQARFESFIYRERCQWQIRFGEWGPYRDWIDDRMEFADQDVDRLLEPLREDKGVYYFRLKEMQDTHGLSASNLIELAELDASHGRTGLLSEALAATALGPRSISGWPGEYPGIEASVLADPSLYGPALLDARLAFDQADYEAAEEMLRKIQFEHKGLYRFLHRFAYFRAVAAEARFNRAKAIFLLKEGLERCPTDVDLLSFLVELGAGDTEIELTDEESCEAIELLERITPDHQLGMTYYHGGLELMGLDLQKAPEGLLDNILLKVYLRGWRQVSADLKVYVAMGKAGGEAVYMAYEEVDLHFPVAFGRGRPQVGAVLALDVLVPEWTANMDWLRIRLVSGGDQSRWLYSDEGLLGLELFNWADYIRLPFVPTQD